MSPHDNHITRKRTDSTKIHLADDSTIVASHSGYASLPFQTSNPIPALQVPSLHEPLLSVAGVCDSGLEILFTKDGCSFHKKGEIQTPIDQIARGERRGDLYILPSKVKTSHPLSCLRVKADNSLLSWHKRLGHVGIKPLRNILSSLNIHPSISNTIDVQKCEVCIQGKLHQRPFSTRSTYRATTKGQIIHSDVGSFEEVSREGYKYWVTYIDDYSKFTIVYLMKSKDCTFNCFKIFRSFFEKHHGPILSL